MSTTGWAKGLRMTSTGRFGASWWMEAEMPHADSLAPRTRKSSRTLDHRHADGVRVHGRRRGGPRPGLQRRWLPLARVARDGLLQGARRWSGACSTRLRRRSDRPREKQIFTLNTAIQAVGEGTMAALEPSSSGATRTPTWRRCSRSRRPTTPPTSNPGLCRRSCRHRCSARTSIAAGPAARCSSRPGATPETGRAGRAPATRRAPGPRPGPTERRAATALGRADRRTGHPPRRGQPQPGHGLAGRKALSDDRERGEGSRAVPADRPHAAERLEGPLGHARRAPH